MLSLIKECSGLYEPYKSRVFAELVFSKRTDFVMNRSEEASFWIHDLTPPMLNNFTLYEVTYCIRSFTRTTIS